MGRTFEARREGKGTDVKTRLVFMPLPGRDASKPLDALPSPIQVLNTRIETIVDVCFFSTHITGTIGCGAGTDMNG